MRKLFNNKGASMVFALFVFLVCAVICSVIVISVTASSGRFSRMTEADSRYFSVTSAAQLLADELVSASVTVERQKIAVSGASPSTDYVTKLDGDEITALFTGEDMSFLQRAAMYAVFADGSYTGAEAWASEPLSAAAAESYSFTLEHAGAKAPPADVNITLAPDGQMTAIVSNTNGADKYKVRLILDIDIFENSQNTTSSQTENSVTETKLLGLRWNLRSMEKAV